MISSKNEIIVEETLPMTQRQEFYSNADFPKLSIIDDNYLSIFNEFNNFINNPKNSQMFTPWVEKTLYEVSDPLGWQVLPLLMNGKRITKYSQNFPLLMNVIEKIDGVITVMLSKLIPDAWISPHSGYENYSNKILRYHLGLLIPEGDLGFRVNSKIKYWENGKSFIFDDSLVHSAWNFSKHDRYILLVDFIRNDKENLESLTDLILTEEAKSFFDFYNKDEK